MSKTASRVLDVLFDHINAMHLDLNELHSSVTGLPIHVEAKKPHIVVRPVMSIEIGDTRDLVGILQNLAAEEEEKGSTAGPIKLGAQDLGLRIVVDELQVMTLDEYNTASAERTKDILSKLYIEPMVRDVTLQSQVGRDILKLCVGMRSALSAIVVGVDLCPFKKQAFVDTPCSLLLKDASVEAFVPKPFTIHNNLTTLTRSTFRVSLPQSHSYAYLATEGMEIARLIQTTCEDECKHLTMPVMVWVQVHGPNAHSSRSVYDQLSDDGKQFDVDIDVFFYMEPNLELADVIDRDILANCVTFQQVRDGEIGVGDNAILAMQEDLLLKSIKDCLQSVFVVDDGARVELVPSRRICQSAFDVRDVQLATGTGMVVTNACIDLSTYSSDAYAIHFPFNTLVSFRAKPLIKPHVNVDGGEAGGFVAKLRPVPWIWDTEDYRHISTIAAALNIEAATVPVTKFFVLQPNENEEIDE